MLLKVIKEVVGLTSMRVRPVGETIVLNLLLVENLVHNLTHVTQYRIIKEKVHFALNQIFVSFPFMGTHISLEETENKI